MLPSHTVTVPSDSPCRCQFKGDQVRRFLLDLAALARTLAWLREAGNALIAWDDAAYPRALLTISDPPPALYFRGRSELLNRPALAIVVRR